MLNIISSSRQRNIVDDYFESRSILLSIQSSIEENRRTRLKRTDNRDVVFGFASFSVFLWSVVFDRKWNLSENKLRDCFQLVRKCSLNLIFIIDGVVIVLRLNYKLVEYSDFSSSLCPSRVSSACWLTSMFPVSLLNILYLRIESCREKNLFSVCCASLSNLACDSCTCLVGWFVRCLSVRLSFYADFTKIFTVRSCCWICSFFFPL